MQQNLLQIMQVFLKTLETTGRTLAYATYYILTDKVVCSRFIQELRIAIPDASIVANVPVLEQLPWLVGRSKKLLPSKSC